MVPDFIFEEKKVRVDVHEIAELAFFIILNLSSKWSFFFNGEVMCGFQEVLQIEKYGGGNCSSSKIGQKD